MVLSGISYILKSIICSKRDWHGLSKGNNET